MSDEEVAKNAQESAPESSPAETMSGESAPPESDSSAQSVDADADASSTGAAPDAAVEVGSLEAPAVELTEAERRAAELREAVEATVDPNAYRVQLPSFEGPLDLLLHLIQQHELDILDIPIAFIAQKYNEYLKLMSDLNIDVAAEYLVMAATLTHIKSKMLLPPDPSQADEDAEEAEEDDPRAELIRRLLEYQKYKQAAEELGNRDLFGRDIFGRGIEAPTVDGPAPLAPIGVFKLLDAFQSVLDRAKKTMDHTIDFERFSITDKINELSGVLSRRPHCRFEELFGEDASRAEVVVTFLALLEMTRLRMIRIEQAGPFETIFVSLAVSPDEESSESLVLPDGIVSPQALAEVPDDSGADEDDADEDDADEDDADEDDADEDDADEDDADEDDAESFQGELVGGEELPRDPAGAEPGAADEPSPRASEPTSDEALEGLEAHQVERSVVDVPVDGHESEPPPAVTELLEYSASVEGATSERGSSPEAAVAADDASAAELPGSPLVEEGEADQPAVEPRISEVDADQPGGNAPSELEADSDEPTAESVAAGPVEQPWTPALSEPDVGESGAEPAAVAGPSDATASAPSEQGAESAPNETREAETPPTAGNDEQE